MSTCADVGSVIESKMSAVQISNVGFTSEVSDCLVVHTGPGLFASLSLVSLHVFSILNAFNCPCFGVDFACICEVDVHIHSHRQVSHMAW